MDGWKGTTTKKLREEEEINSIVPDFLNVCSECGIEPDSTIPVAKRNCSLCVIRFYTENDNKQREHNWNLKVKVQVVGYHCLDCDFRISSLNQKMPECKGKIDIPEYITPIPFKPSKVIEGIHPAKFKPFTPLKARTPSFEKKEKTPKIKKAKPSFSIEDEMPDFLKGI